MAYPSIMTKSDAIQLFGDVKSLSNALNITRQAIYQWPEDINESTKDRIIGAAIRCKKTVPDQFISKIGDELHNH